MAVGDLIADGLINLLSSTPQLCVLSRLSTRNLAITLKQGGILAPGLANYLLTGSYADFGGKVLVSWELAATSDTRILATGRQTVALVDLLEPSCDFFMQTATSAVSAMMAEEVGKTSRQAIPTLPSYSLMLAGVSEMHRNSVPAFNRSYEALNSLIDRHPRFAQPKTWLAKWYVLRSVTAAGSGAQDEAQRALELTQRALDVDPTNSMSLAMQGYVYNHMVGDPSRASQCLDRALAINPNDSLAWLYHSVVQGMWGDSAQAVTSAVKAFALSPLDPLAYFYKSLQASALLADGQFAQAATIAQESLRLNRLHTPSYRVLLTAQHGMGRHHEAALTLKALMALEPHFSLARYSSGFSAQSRTKKQTIEALKAIGNIATD
jgi:adenylate cyclase